MRRLAGFDQPLGLAKSGGVEKNDDLFLSSWVKEVASHFVI
jgi:hypothetical protein